MRLLQSLVLVTLTLFLLNDNLYAGREVDDSIALSEKLNELEMFDLSLYLLAKTERENPQQKDMVTVQKAQTFFKMRKTKEAQALLKSIPSTSEAYAFARYVLGTTAIEGADNVTGARALEEYCAFMKSSMPKRNSSLGKQFIKAVSYLIHAYKAEAKLDKLEKATSYLEWKFADEGDENAPENPDDKYHKLIMNIQTKLDAAAIMKREGKEEWKKTVEEFIPQLKDVYWTGRSQYSAMAAIEIAKAYCLLEKYDEGLKELTKYWELIKSLDEGYRSEGLSPPSAKAYLWKGHCNIGLGEKEADKEKKIKLLFTAAKCYLNIIKNYDHKKCYYIDKAVEGFNNAKRLLAKEGKNLRLPSNIKLPGGFDRKRADDMFNKEKFADAIPLYMEILQSEGGRSSKETPDILKLISISYLRTGKTLESLALATYLGEYFPEDPATPDALLAVGETLWKDYKKSPTTPVGKTAQDNAMMLYKTYLKHCPTHKYADEISARSAKVYFDKANEMALKANKMPSGPEKLKKNEEAREAFKQAIPIYQKIIDNYLHTDQGKEAAFLLAWCYTNSRQYVKGAEVFAKYADAEFGREKKEKRNFGRIVESKFRVAENYSRAAADLEKEAKQYKKDAENAPTEAALASAPPKKGKKVPLSEEALLKKSEETIAKAKEYFKVAVTNLNELLDKWMKNGGRLTEATLPKHKDKIKEFEEKGTSLLCWSYDGSRDNKNAIKAFSNFIKKYPKHKDVPKSMLRLGMLYIEEDQPNEAAAVLNELNAKYPEEGKKALPRLARTMYELKQYDKSIDAAEKIFAGTPTDMAVSDIKWIAKNLYDCDGKFPERGAAISLKACDILNKKIEKPVLAEWVGKAKAKELANNPEETAKIIGILKDQLQFITANVAFRAKKYQKSIDAFSNLLENKESPYFLKAHSMRAQAFMANKEPQKALDNDFNAISLYLYSAPQPESVTFENQCRIGDAYILLGNYNKAVGALSYVTMTLLDTDTDTDKDLGLPKKEVTAAEKKKQRKWLEYALFMSACCEKKIGNKEKIPPLLELYRKHFNKGKFDSKLNALPTPEEAMELK